MREQREVRLERKAEARTGCGRPHMPAQQSSLTSAPAGRDATQAEARRQRPIHLVFWEDGMPAVQRVDRYISISRRKGDQSMRERR